METIDLNSWHGNLYFERQKRVGRFIWDRDDVIERQGDQVNLCKYVRNVALQLCFILLAEVIPLIMVFFVFSIAALDPIISGILWLVTDNPFIWFFGGFATIFLTAILSVFAIVFSIAVGSEKLAKKVHAAMVNAQAEAHMATKQPTMSSANIVGTWLKGLHSKVCVSVKLTNTVNK